MRISLEKLVFFGYHGIYAEEKKIGNTFEVDVAIDFPTPPKNIHQLDPLYKHIEFVYSKIFGGIENAFTHYSTKIYPHASQNIKSPEGLLSILKYGKTGYLPEHQDQGVSSRVLSTVAYLNSDYVGGEIYFPQIDIEIKPEPGSIIFFPSNFVFTHTVKPITSGFRYAVPQWYHNLKQLSCTKRTYF